MTTYDFDTQYNRRGSDSVKWSFNVDENTLPMWVADMDFRLPEPMLKAVHQRVDEGFFGYAVAPQALKDVIVDRNARLYDWTITTDDLVFLPGVVSGLFITAREFAKEGDGIIVQPPVYAPFFSAIKNTGRIMQENPLVCIADGQDLRYEIDFDALESLIQPNTKMFFLCNPHNPVGRVLTKDELQKIADLCLKHDLVIVSDEIHSDLLLGDQQHIPIASLSPEIAQRTITLTSASKTFSMPSLSTAYAVVQNEEWRKKIFDASWGVGHATSVGYAALLSGYRDCEDWITQLRAYLTANRDYAVNYIKTNLPELPLTTPEGTYLMWIDCNALGLGQKPADFFKDEADVFMNDGAWFGAGGEGFIRLNFACPRAQLQEALERIAQAVKSLRATTD